MANLFKQTLNKEAEVKEVETMNKEILDREEANKDVEQFNIVNTVSEIQEGNIRVVKIKTLDCPEGFPIGAATSDKDAKAMIVRGFAYPISKELPLEYAVEMNNLINFFCFIRYIIF